MTTARPLTVLLALPLFAGLAPAAAQSIGGEVAYVESVSGRVVALVQGKPVLLDVLDMIDEKTRLDLLANSNLRLCHYRTQRIVALQGPLRVSVTAAGVAAENGKDMQVSGESCVKPAVSNFQGGFVARTAGLPSTKVSVRPTIKILNKTTTGIRDITLWDGTQQRIIISFDRTSARPTLIEGQSYLLVVARNDGTEMKMLLQASPLVEPQTLVVVVK